MNKIITIILVIALMLAMCGCMANIDITTVHGMKKIKSNTDLKISKILLSDNSKLNKN
jgi:hypothetical protein